MNSIPSRGYLEVRFTVYALPDVSLLVLDFEYRVVSRHVQTRTPPLLRIIKYKNAPLSDEPGGTLCF